MNSSRYIFAVFLGLVCFSKGISQSKTEDSLKIVSDKISTAEKYPQFVFKGLFQGRFVSSLNKDVSVEGVHHTDDSGVSNTFLLKYMRVQARAIVSKRTEVAILVNLADFKNDPINKVLENAYIKYTFNPKIAITFGQFRPLFGIEESYPVDVLRSLDWSSQYTEFGKLGWTSFQIGAAVTGYLKLGNMPFQYAISIVNGNGKNQVSDKDDGKQYSTRLVFGIAPKYNFNIGLNAGVGEVFKQSVYALGLDATGHIKFSDKWNLDLQAEAKEGDNHSAFFALPVEDRISSLKNYKIWGVYFLPALRYEIDNAQHTISALEFTCRYEYIDKNYKLDSNPQQIITPMFGLEFLKNYNARIQVGTQISRFKRSIENTSIYNSNLFVTQVQVRF